MNLIEAIRLADDLFYGRVIVERVPPQRIVQALHTLKSHVDGLALELAEEAADAEAAGNFNL